MLSIFSSEDTEREKRVGIEFRRVDRLSSEDPLRSFALRKRLLKVYVYHIINWVTISPTSLACLLLNYLS